MNQILDQLKKKLEDALKSRDETAVSSLRFMLANIHNEEIAKQKPLSDEEVLSVIKRQVKRHEESIEAFKKGRRNDLVEKEEAEKKILEVFLPPEMSEEEIRQVVKESLSSGVSDFGPLMSQVMGKLKGQADGAVVARIVKEELQN